ncbi:hypothetical protein ACI2JQ_00720 [Pseudomonas fulva]|uniref:hypothetical protein n=1 Tax=Pseudomonas fulva TaxID=47880 RepID=UPI00384C04C6
MESVCYVPDQSECTILQYQQNPDMYRGNIICDKCQEKSWFVKGFATEKYVRAPCFAAHHADKCDNKIVLIPDDDGPSTSGVLSAINIDLDKQRKQDINVAVPQSRPKKETPWGTVRKYSNVGDYPENKSLRQILTSLGRDPDFPPSDKQVKMVADGGRVVLEGVLADHLVSQSEMSGVALGEPRIFWGRINNVNRQGSSLWLNCGDYKREPSILIDDEDLEEQLVEDFRLRDVDDLQGADFIVVGVAFKAANGKSYIKFGFTKYIAFRKYRLQ